VDDQPQQLFLSPGQTLHRRPRPRN
jgi:hypothetical protein